MAGNDVTNGVIKDDVVHKKNSRFVKFTSESLKKIEKRIEEDKLLSKKLEEKEEMEKVEGKKVKTETSCKQLAKRRVNVALVAGKTFPDQLGVFPEELYGKPIEELDDFYSDKYVSSQSM